MLLPALLLLGAGAGCADRTPPPRYSNLDYTLVELMAPAGTPTYAVTPPVALVNPRYATECAYDAPTASFVCPTIVTNGITQTFSYQLFDAAGVPLAAWIEANVASVRVVRTADGRRPTAALAYDTVHGRSDRTISGLLGDQPVINGRDTNSVIIIGGDSLVHSTNVVVWTDFLPRIRNVPFSYPLSGAIRAEHWTAFVPLVGSPDSLYELTFNGSSVVQWTTTSGGVTTNCTYTYGTNGLPVCP